MPQKGMSHSAETIEKLRLAKLGKPRAAKGQSNKPVDTLTDQSSTFYLTGNISPNNLSMESRKDFAVIVCPICKTVFTKAFSLALFYKTKKLPICCSARCDLTLNYTLDPIDTHQGLIQWTCDHQILYRASDILKSTINNLTHTGDIQRFCSIEEYGSREMFNFDLQREIGHPVKYGDYRYASEKEQIQQAKDLCHLQDRTQKRIKEIRQLLAAGYSRMEISKRLRRSPSNITHFFAKYQDYL